MKAELTTGTMLFVDVPNEANRFKMFPDILSQPYLSYFIGVETFRKYVDFGFELLGLSNELTEEQLKEVMGKSIHTSLFPHYVNGIKPNIYCYKTALESFNSLKRSLGVVDDKKYVVLFKKKQ